MKRLLMLAALVMPASAQAQVWVNGHVKSDGTYVMPHFRTAPNATTYDNYKPRPYVNPYAPKIEPIKPYRPYRYEPYKAPCYYNCK